eukprot:TRINITY_DN14030_c0_g1_i1.p1 TRINITY_DN14030_c0_g1~~TRINITY_DN14030_c0_g1_i1.p1  ORF type:complete len:670 (+),score=196.95 TRINITY_DN14030_c0_g1_i1:87-2096(+)
MEEGGVFEFAELDTLVQRDLVEVSVQSSRVNTAISMLMKAVKVIGNQTSELRNYTQGGQGRMEDVFSEIDALKEKVKGMGKMDDLTERVARAEQECARVENDLRGAKNYILKLEERIRKQEERRIPDVEPLQAEIAQLQESQKQHRNATDVLEAHIGRLKESAKDVDSKLQNTVKDLHSTDDSVDHLYKLFAMHRRDVPRIVGEWMRKPTAMPSPCLKYLQSLPVFADLEERKADRTEVQEGLTAADEKLAEMVEMLDGRILVAMQRIVLKLDKSIFETFASEMAAKMRRAEELGDEIRRLEKILDTKADSVSLSRTAEDIEKRKADRGDLMLLADKDDLDLVSKDITWLREKFNELATTIDLQVRQLTKELAVANGGGTLPDLIADLDRLKKKSEALQRTDARLDDVKADKEECANLRDCLEALAAEFSRLRALSVQREQGGVPQGGGSPSRHDSTASRQGYVPQSSSGLFVGNPLGRRAGGSFATSGVYPPGEVVTGLDLAGEWRGKHPGVDKVVVQRRQTPVWMPPRTGTEGERERASPVPDGSGGGGGGGGSGGGGGGGGFVGGGDSGGQRSGSVGGDADWTPHQDGQPATVKSYNSAAGLRSGSRGSVDAVVPGVGGDSADGTGGRSAAGHVGGGDGGGGGGGGGGGSPRWRMHVGQCQPAPRS